MFTRAKQNYWTYIKISVYFELSVLVRMQDVHRVSGLYQITLHSPDTVSGNILQ